MKYRKHAYAAAALGLSTALTLAGCIVGEGLNAALHAGSGAFEHLEKQRTLERVARDWCLTIRASQVIPVYPLDEDIEVGDAYIVDTPIAKLKSYWNKRGYLPIDHRFGRFQPTGFAEYYHDGGYGVVKGVAPPRHWQFPVEPLPSASKGAAPAAGKTAPAAPAPAPAADATAPKAAAPAAGGTAPASPATGASVPAQALEDLPPTGWEKAPRAGFPSYGFRIKRGESLNLAIPVQGVPVAMAALGAREVTGTVTLTDAYTYGIDEISLRANLIAWSELPDVAAALRVYAPARDSRHPERIPAPVNFLRIVTRVYLVRSVNVALNNTGASVAQLSAGAPKDPAGNITFNGNQSEDALLGQLYGQIYSQELEKTDPRAAAPKPADDTAAAPTPAPATPPATTPAPTAGTSPAAPADSSKETDPAIAAEKAKLDRMEKQIELEERRQKLLDRRQKLQASGQQRDVDASILRRALTRSEMRDKFGGYQLPGGTLQVASATATSISMVERFARPLVVGYHALEFGIHEGGRLSVRAVSTFDRMEASREASFHPLPYRPVDPQLTKDLRSWWSASDNNKEFAERWLKKKGVDEFWSVFVGVGTARYYELQLELARTVGLR